jgi:pyruvate/2-oxoglutarate dehydrogenase complex dihydrolipoamide acyltransferase (E2) component
MAIPVVMPKFGQTMTEGTIVSWEKKVGDEVKKGEVLLRIETDKTEMEVEADEGGSLLRVDAQPGQQVPCGVTIAWLGRKGEKI